jgi:hypothetical protein
MLGMREPIGRRSGDYIIRIKDGRVKGVAILNAKRHLDKRFEDGPAILKMPARAFVKRYKLI